jgi:UDP-N-acetylglucosamine diphosphorylase/glucosamine-1-phosphate N-acetyltransferase
MKDSLATIILAAGQGKRMKSDLPKVLHPVLGKPLVKWVIEQARAIGSERIVAVIGHKKELVQEELKDDNILFAIQEQQLGTGHAIQQAEPFFKDWEKGHILILSGDVPALTGETLQSLFDTHLQQQADGTVLTAIFDNPKGYGRIVRDSDDTLRRIVEEKDADDEIRQIKEINSGIYIFRRELLFDYLRKVDNDNAQNEYYLPDILPMLVRDGYKVALQVALDPDEISGINTIEQLQAVEQKIRLKRGEA